MLQFPRSLLSSHTHRVYSRAKFRNGLRHIVVLSLAALMFLVPLSFSAAAPQLSSGSKHSPASDGDFFVIYQGAGGEAECRLATSIERNQIRRANPAERGMRPINHFERELNSGITNAPDGTNAVAANLTIILRGTNQLQNYPEAVAAFDRAAQAWEDLIKSPVTIYLDVDFGPTFFGTAYGDPDILGQTQSLRVTGPYSSVRNSLIASASSTAETSLYNSLPSTSLPTDLGSAGSIAVSATIARAIGILPATASGTDLAAKIGFNSAFQFDFNPSDGITGNRTDFEAVATHEIGHALGFVSSAGVTSLQAPALWDLFRFRTGVTLGTFGTAQRIMSASGQQYYFSGGGELALSTGGPNGDATGGDTNQSSHWKQAALNQGVYVGIMDPRIPRNTRRVITSNDTFALNYLGFNLDNNDPPPPPPPPPAVPVNDNFANAITLSGCSGNTTSNTFSATREAGEPNHSANNAGGKSIWYRWQAPNTGNVTITTAGSDYDTMLGVYTGNSVSSTALTRIADNDDQDFDNDIFTSQVVFPAQAGTVYRIAVDGYGGASGAVALSWSLSGCTAPTNPIDGAQFFVDQHYKDFLGRAADAGGLQYWSEQISGNASNTPASCPAGDRVCEHIRRISVSAAFFVENEFQRTGGFVYRFYKASYGTRPTFQQFTADRSLVPENAQLEQNKQAFANQWVQRPEFISKYPASLNNGAAFVDAILLNVLQNSNVDLSGQRNNLINTYATGGRAAVVRSVADNTSFATAEYNKAFVVMQYFGYLQRSPDEGGYQFWLNILDNQVPNNFRAMVCAFLTSAEYQQRFGSTVTRTNSDCAVVGP